MGSLIGLEEGGKPYRKEYEEAPFIIRKGKRQYEFVKEYESFYLYRDCEAGYNMCFNKCDFAKEIIKPDYSAKYNK